MLIIQEKSNREFVFAFSQFEYMVNDRGTIKLYFKVFDASFKVYDGTETGIFQAIKDAKDGKIGRVRADLV